MSKGQPDFFGTPTQRKYGAVRIDGDDSISIDSSIPFDQTYQYKGVVNSLLLTTFSVANASLVAVELTIDGVVCMYSFFDGQPSTTVVTRTVKRAVIERCDLENGRMIIRFPIEYSVDSYVRVRLITVPGYTVHQVSLWIFGEEIV